MSPLARQERPLGAWCRIVFLVVAVAVLHGVTAQEADAPPIPAASDGPAARDDLALVARQWAETGEDEGLLRDLIGESREVPAWEVAYRIHGDIAGLEGALLSHADTPSPRPVYNTGLRLDRVVFHPPLELADGGRLGSVFPPALSWTLAEDLPSAPAHRYAFEAAVPAPVNGTSSPPADGNRNQTTDIVLRWTVEAFDDPAPDGATGVRSPAVLRIEWSLDAPDEALAETTQIARTNVSFHFLFDFGDTVLARAATGPAPLDATGSYLYRGNTSATLRFLEPARWLNDLQQDAPGERAARIAGPIRVNATGVWSTTVHGEEDLSYTAHLFGEFGYLVDLPEPRGTEDRSGAGSGESPALPLSTLVVLLLFLLARSRTEAHR